ncbi:MAG: hypothetical protein AABX48_01930 [Nanoarchaeota archaeon]
MGCCDLHDNVDREWLWERDRREREAYDKEKAEEAREQSNKVLSEIKESRRRHPEIYEEQRQRIQQKKVQQQLLYQRRLDDLVIKADIESIMWQDGSIPRFLKEFRIDEGFNQVQLNEMTELYRRVGETLGFRIGVDYNKTSWGDNNSLKSVTIKGWKWPYVEREV